MLCQVQPSACPDPNQRGVLSAVDWSLTERKLITHGPMVPRAHVAAPATARAPHYPEQLPAGGRDAA